MPVTEVLARGFVFEVDTGVPATPTWVAVGGINSWSHSPQANDANTTTFDDEGRMSHMKASRGDQFTISGLYQEDPADGSRDPGQEAVEAWADEIGPASRKLFQITSPGGVVKTFSATAAVTSGGGGNDDPTAWSAAVTVDGAITTV